MTDPRIDTLAQAEYRAFWTQAMYSPEEKPWSSASDLAQEIYRNRAAARLRAVDAADADAGVVRVDLNNDSQLDQLRRALTLHDDFRHDDTWRQYRRDAVRAALRGNL